MTIAKSTSFTLILIKASGPIQRTPSTKEPCKFNHSARERRRRTPVRVKSGLFSPLRLCPESGHRRGLNFRSLQRWALCFSVGCAGDMKG